MALGKRRQKQAALWVETSQLQALGRHANGVLDAFRIRE